MKKQLYFIPVFIYTFIKVKPVGGIKIIDKFI